MNSAKPPRLAVWLLEEFGPKVNREALTGDLNEAFQQGRSKAWYWRQVLAAVRWRRNLYLLLLIAAWSWMMTSPGKWNPAPIISRPLDMAVLIVGFLGLKYLPEMLRGWLRAVLAVLIVISFCLLFHYSSDMAHHYLPLGILFIWCLVFHRKKLPPPPYHLPLRELLLGDTFAERKRMIAKLEQTMMEETDPGLRQAYAESIAALRRRVPPGTRMVE